MAKEGNDPEEFQPEETIVLDELSTMDTAEFKRLVGRGWPPEKGSDSAEDED